MKTTTPILAALSIALLSCDAAPEEEASAAEATPRSVSWTPAPAEHARAAAPKTEHAALHLAHKLHVAPSGQETFEEVMALIEEHYVDGALSEDELWTAATEGVLQRLVHLKGHPINTLMSPAELAELEAGSQGRVVGVGVMIERLADVVLIKGVIEGGPAEAAGLKSGDRILGIDGERVRDMEIMEVAHKIRGEEGSKVELFVQRDTEEWTETITRNPFVVSSVESRLLEEGVGVLRINNFAKQTTQEVKAALSELSEQGMKSLVLDLRHCPGGLLEPALQTADAFLAPGKRIVTVKSRDGKTEDIDAEASDPWESLPLAVVVGHKTASGAEILAAALDENDRGPVIGAQTFGKGTVESIHELSNGWAVKLSVSRFYSPDGENRQNVGMRPGIAVPALEDAHWGPLATAVLDEDPQLAAAVDLMAAHSADEVAGGRGTL